MPPKNGSSLTWRPHGSIQDNNNSLSSITGSMHELSVRIGKKICILLIDAGGYNGSPQLCLLNNHLPINATDVDSIITTHNHFDHIARVPRIVGAGYEGNIYMTRDSHYAFQEIMEDSLFVNLSEVAKKNSIINRKRQALGRRLNQALSNKDKNTLKEYGITKNSDIKKVLDKECGTQLDPIFTEQDLYKTLGQVKSFDYTRKGQNNGFQVFESSSLMQARFLPSEHIFGSAMILFELQKNTNSRRKFNILWCGDLGRNGNRIYGNSPDMGIIKKPLDMIFIESTYGGRNHPDLQEEIEKLETNINITFQRGGQIMIPCFTQTRYQEMLLYLIDSIESGKEGSIPDDTHIICDSPGAKNLLQKMAISNNRYSKIINHPNITWSSGKNTVPILLEENRNHIFVMSGGMMQGGTGMKLIPYFNKKSTLVNNELVSGSIAKKGLVIMTGYASENTLGRQIKNNPSLYNATNLNLSGHIDHQGIIHFITNHDKQSGIELRTNAKICLMHGEIGAMYKLKEGLVEGGIKEENIIIPVVNGSSFEFPL